MNDIDSPTGIDLRPEPPNPVRLSKRAGLIALVVVTAVVGLVGTASQHAASGPLRQWNGPIQRGSQLPATRVR